MTTALQLAVSVGAFLANTGPASAQQTVVTNGGDYSVAIVDLGTGERETLASPSVGSGPFLSAPFGVGRVANGDILIGTNVGNAQIFRINPVSAERSIVSGPLNGSGPAMSAITALAVLSDATIIARSSGNSSVFRVDPVTGDRTVVASATVGSGASITPGHGLWAESDTSIVLTNYNSHELIRLDLLTGAREVISSASVGTGPNLASPTGVVRLPDGAYAVLNHHYSPYLLKVDSTTGNRTSLSASTVGDGPEIGARFGLSITADGALYVADFSNHAIVKVDPATGDRTVVASASVGSGPALAAPYGLLSPSVLSVKGKKPEITSSDTAFGTYGSAFSYQITADHAPTLFDATGLPWGLRIDEVSGMIDGFPSQSGTFDVTLSATNAGGTTTALLKLEVAPAELTVAAKAGQSKAYGDQEPELFHSITEGSLIYSSDALTGHLARTPGEDAGTYPITLGTLSAGPNYTVTFVPDEFTIKPAFAHVNIDHSERTYTGAPQQAPVTTAPANLPLTVTYDGSTDLPISAGSYQIVAKVADPNYTGIASGPFVITKGVAEVSLSHLTQTYDGKSKKVSASTSPAGLPVVVTYNGETTPPTDAQSYKVSATVDDPNYVGYTSGILRIGQAEQTISFTPVGAIAAGKSAELKAVATSGLPVTFSVSGPATLTGSTLFTTGAGAVTVRASQPGNANYAAAASVDQEITVSQAVATVTLGNLDHTYDGAAKKASVTTSPAGLSVSLTYNGSPTPPTEAGTYKVIATVTDPNHEGTAAGTLTIGKAKQSIDFQLPAKLQIGTPVGLTATASSGLPVTFSVLKGDAALAGDTLTVKGAGSVVVRALQQGDKNHESAFIERSTGDLAKLLQSITFAPLPDKPADERPFVLSATASSGLPVAFTVTSGPAMLSGNTLTPTGIPGRVVVRASQPGNAVYQPAADIVHAFEVTAVGPRVYFGSLGKGADAQEVAAEVSTDGRFGTLIGVIPGTGEGFVANFEVGADGVWTAAVTPFGVSSASPSALPLAVDDDRAASRTRVTKSTGTTRTFRGVIEGGVLTGTIDELGLTFSANLQPPVGPTASIAGYYEAPSLNSATGSTYSVVGTEGRAYVLVITTSTVAGSSGSMQPNGTFSIQTSQGLSIVGRVDASTTAVTGKITLPDGATESFSGVRESTLRTDRLVNLSTRARVAANGGSGTLITGFVIGGSSPKTVLLRGVGPTLTQFGLSNVLADPRLRVFNAKAEIIAENDNWGGTAELTTAMNRVGAFALPADSKDAVLLLDLAPGAYSVHVLNGGQGGVALAEIYDASSNPQSEYQRLINISSRGLVAAGDGVLIGGFAVTGNAPKRILVRGAGPALAAYNVPGVLADPQIRLFNSSGAPIAENNDWGTPTAIDSVQASATGGEIAAANAAVGAFAFADGSKDAALVVTLAPGNYTVHLSGVGGATGVGLIEIYEVTP